MEAATARGSETCRGRTVSRLNLNRVPELFFDMHAKFGLLVPYYRKGLTFCRHCLFHALQIISVWAKSMVPRFPLQSVLSLKK